MEKISSGTFQQLIKSLGRPACCRTSRDPQAGIQRGLWVKGSGAGVGGFQDIRTGEHQRKAPDSAWPCLAESTLWNRWSVGRWKFHNRFLPKKRIIKIINTDQHSFSRGSRNLQLGHLNFNLWAWTVDSLNFIWLNTWEEIWPFV